MKTTESRDAFQCHHDPYPDDLQLAYSTLQTDLDISMVAFYSRSVAILFPKLSSTTFCLSPGFSSNFKDAVISQKVSFGSSEQVIPLKREADHSTASH